ncbi:MAG TPA: class I SAM-dependent methyltransferase [Verrucomicrobiae bacterium]|jgi:23S rRNA (cytosine1962-C5)-methyltransferase
MNLTENQPVRLRLRITATAETIVRGGHPWVFTDSVLESNRAGKTGELAVIFDRKDKFLAIGFFDADSPIRVRILHVGKPQTINSVWWCAHLEKSLARRRHLFDAQTNGFRLINGESDGWPGLVLDQYAGTLVLKVYTAAWLPWLAENLSWLKEKIAGERSILRLSRNIQAIAEKQFKLRDGGILWGTPPEGAVIFSENGIRFEADVLRGQKTGFFLDQRENRAEVEKLSSGKTVLNAFSFSGGFSLYAARGGAKSVTDLDISAHALESARRNFHLNQHFPGVAACRHETVQADTFEWLPSGPEKFDLIILDPPSMAKRATEREGAIRAYERLNSLGIARLERGGILVAGSCSAQVSAAEFFEAVRRAAQKSGRKFSELKTLQHAPDHPATFKEAEYLKVIYLKFSE